LYKILVFSDEYDKDDLVAEKEYNLFLKKSYRRTPLARSIPGSMGGTGAWPIQSEMPASDHRDTGRVHRGF